MYWKQNNPNDLHFFLKEFRAKINETLEDMSLKLEMAPSTLSKIENSKLSIPKDFQHKFLKVYNLSTTQKLNFNNAIINSKNKIYVDMSMLDKSIKIELKQYLFNNNIPYILK